MKENTVHSGHYELLLLVSDLQGETAVHNLSVTVCNCLDPARPNCHIRKATGSTVGGGAFGIIVFSLLLFVGRRHSHSTCFLVIKITLFWFLSLKVKKITYKIHILYINNII